MAATLVNSLYPPLMDTFMPAFVEDGSGDSVGYINFSISPYNDTKSINYIHVSLINQQTNMNVLRSGSYDDDVVIADGILIMPFDNVIEDEESGLYQVQVKSAFLKGDTKTVVQPDGSSKSETVAGRFLLDTFYQAQIRFDNSDEISKSPVSHLIEEREHFSEWSNVTLLHAIPRPVFLFKNLDMELDSTHKTPVYRLNEYGNGRWTYELAKNDENYAVQGYNKGLVPFSADIYWLYNDSFYNNTNEYLTSYSITIYPKGDRENPLIETEVIHTGNDQRDSFYYLADMNQAIQNTQYIFHIDATSRNGYEWWDEREIEIASFSSVPFSVNWNFSTVKINAYGDVTEKIVTEEDGFVTCQVTTKDDMPPGYLYIYRSSSLDNYVTNQIIQVTKHDGPVSVVFQDKTVGSLVRYRYKAQYKLEAGPWSRVEKADKYVYPDFYDMLFLRQDKQLAVRFDGNLSSLKPVVNRTKIDTLGSKYPRFAENALMNYKQFSLSGIISAEEDFNRQFVNERTDTDLVPGMTAYNDEIGQVDIVRNDTILESTETPLTTGFHDTYPLNHWYLEREFREKAMQWLNNGEPKLFRSMTEGNMIVMLTDISLTPVQNVDRRLYNFSATMYEIANGYDIDILAEYGIITIKDEEHNASISGEGSGAVHYLTTTKIGQFINTYASTTTEYRTIVTNAGGLNLNDDTGSYNLALASIQDYILADLTGINKTRVFHKGSIILKDVRIQFTSKSKWIQLGYYSGGAWIENDPPRVINLDTEDVDITQPGLTLGYLFKVKTGNDTKAKSIFVGPQGYYQFPSDLTVTDLQFRPTDDFAIDYIIEYETSYDNSSLITKTETVRKVVGQYSGPFQPQVVLGDNIRQQYTYRSYQDGQLYQEELMENWSAISLDVTPYAVAMIKAVDADSYEERLVGQTGVYTLMNDFPTQDIFFAGRRMLQAPHDNRPYLDEWEFVLDQSVTNVRPTDEDDVEDYWYEIVTLPPHSTEVQETDQLVLLSMSNDETQQIFSYWGELDYAKEQEYYGYLHLDNVKKPQYNTVYKVVNSQGEDPMYVIYYLDRGWYTVKFEDESMKSLIAYVPIQGMINYKGIVIKRTYNINRD